MTQYVPPPPGWPPPLPPPPARRRRTGVFIAMVSGAVAAVILLVLIAVLAVVVVRRHASQQPTASDGHGCSYVPGGGGSVARKVKPPPASGLPTTGQVVARMATNRGQLTITLDRTTTPCTVNSFVSLARQKYFDGTSCHRLTTAGFYVLQYGDPSGTGGGGPGYSFADEHLPADQTTAVSYPAGTVAMANAGPGTNGSQFFLVYQDTRLPPAYTIFGKVTGGLAHVQQVAKAGSDPTGDGKPKLPVNIESVTVG